jgi:hypothetical protein
MEESTQVVDVNDQGAHSLRPYQQELLDKAIEDNVRTLTWLHSFSHALNCHAILPASANMQHSITSHNTKLLTLQ